MLLFKLCLFVLVIACYENVASGGNVWLPDLHFTVDEASTRYPNDLLQFSKQAPDLVNAVLAVVRMFVKKVSVCECVSCRRVNGAELPN